MLRSCVGILTVTAMWPGILSQRSRRLLDVPLERLHGGLDLVCLKAAADGVEGLQALARDQDRDALVRADPARVGELLQNRRGHAAGGLGEDAGGLGEQADARPDLVVVDRVDAAAG